MKRSVVLPESIPKQVSYCPLIERLVAAGLEYVGTGKVRITFGIPEYPDLAFLVTTDRISARDVVLPTAIVDKGPALTAMTVWGLTKVLSGIDHHLIAYGSDIADFLPSENLRRDRGLLARSMVIRRAAPLPVEAIVRGYLTGSGLKDYEKSGSVCGIELPSGLRNGDKLPEPIFTPSTKAELGQHDENIDLETLAGIIEWDYAKQVRDLALFVYNEISRCALERGIIVADTKLEFGIINDQVVLIDEVGTPDSSRFWTKEAWEIAVSDPNRPDPESLDKEPMRRHVKEHGFGPLPHDVVAETTSRYRGALSALSGMTLESFLRKEMSL
jgi:phosphoribosylaminoimidazole-succinocarboxamide synthase